MDFRFMKTKDERMADTLAYAQAKLSATDSADLAGKVNALAVPQQTTLAAALSLGATGTSADRTANREARRAKRTLMLASSVYINDANLRRNELARVQALPEGSEQDLLAELRSWFTVPGVTAQAVAADAEANIAQMPNWDNKNFEPENAVRGKYQKGKAYEFNCYNGVVFWAFQAGAISRRFLFNFLKNKDGNNFFPIFSRIGWQTDVEYGAGGMLINDVSHGGEFTTIPVGVAVYFTTPVKVFGHVALSLGNGLIISQNSVAPAFPNAIQANDREAVHQMERAETHIISIRSFWNIHYNEKNGYNKLQHTNGGFWEAFPLNER
jgi:hypothetical protein